VCLCVLCARRTQGNRWVGTHLNRVKKADCGRGGESKISVDGRLQRASWLGCCLLVCNGDDGGGGCLRANEQGRTGSSRLIIARVRDAKMGVRRAD
jgi:hypothetical protein